MNTLHRNPNACHPELRRHRGTSQMEAESRESPTAFVAGERVVVRSLASLGMTTGKRRNEIFR
jgi:hypothetical protein